MRRTSNDPLALTNNQTNKRERKLKQKCLHTKLHNGEGMRKENGVYNTQNNDELHRLEINQVVDYNLY